MNDEVKNGEDKNFRALRMPPHCLQNVGPGAYQSHYEVRIAGRDLRDKEIFTPELFINCRETLRPGDEVTVCGFADQTWSRLTQFVHLRIVSCGREGVRFVMDGEIVPIPFDKDEKKPEPEPDKVYVKRGFGGVFTVFAVKDDSCIEEYKTKAEADARAKRINAGGF